MRNDILIVGGGPVGLTTALLLARQGLRVLVIEKDQTPQHSPSAVALDDECLRIWQACGLEQALDEDWDGGHRGQVMCEYLSPRGRPFLRLTQHESDLGYPHAVVIHLARITDKLRQCAEREPSIELLSGCSVVGIEQDDQSVSIRCESDNEAPRNIRGAWAVGCDGGASMTRKLLGIDMLGETLRNPWLIADLEDDQSSGCVQIQCDPRHPSITVPMPHGIRRIECMLAPDEGDALLEDECAVRRRLSLAWAQALDAPIRALTIKQFNARVAERWRSGRIFLAGDAAHQTPPFAGQGLATGLRDASNLAFKLAGVNHGWLPDDVLDTYEQERRPHQERMIRLAMRLGSVMAPKSIVHALLTQSAIRSMMTIGSVRKHVQLRGPGIRPILHDGFMANGPMVGRYLPQPWVTAGGSSSVRLDTLLGPRMTWIAIGDSDAPGRMPRGLLAPDETALIENHDFRDSTRKLQRCYGAGSLVLIRPDRVVHTHCVHAMAQNRIARNSPWTSISKRQPNTPPLHGLSA